MTNQFNLNSEWHIPAPIEEVWNTLIQTQEWPDWWRYVNKVEEIKVGEVSGLQNIRRFYWKTCLPYRLVMELCVSRLEPYRVIETTVTGDLKGIGTCYLSERQNFTQVVFQWNVRLNKAWMTVLAPIARPVFIWNHSQVMKQGEQSLIQHLSSE